MARIGLKSFRYSGLTEAQDGTPTYSGSHVLAKAVSCNVSINFSSASLYADDSLAEHSDEFVNGTVSLVIDDDNIETMAYLCGHTYANGVMTRNSNDVAPYVGFGRVITKVVNNVKSYKVELLKKVMFHDPNQEENTKGESLEYGTVTLEGTVAQLANGQWSDSAVFTTFAEAQAWLDTQLGGTTPAETATVTYNANGGTGSYSAVTVGVGSMITLPNGAALTPPSGKVFDGWDTTSTSASGDLKGSYIVTGDVTLYAIYVTE